MSEPTLDNIARSFERHLRAENKSPKTVTTYMEAVTQLAGLLGQDGRSLADARRGDVETFITDLVERRTAATASTATGRRGSSSPGWRTRERSRGGLSVGDQAPAGGPARR